MQRSSINYYEANKLFSTICLDKKWLIKDASVLPYAIHVGLGPYRFCCSTLKDKIKTSNLLETVSTSLLTYLWDMVSNLLSY